MRLQNTLTILVRGIELIVLAALILAALYVCVGRLLVSTSEFFRTDLEDLLETRYAVSVQTGSVQGSWQRFDTIVDITDIRIGDPDNPALKSDTVRVRISPLHSLIKGRLVVTEIDFLNLNLSLEEHTPGKWNVVGMTGFDKPVDFEYLLDSLPPYQGGGEMILSVSFEKTTYNVVPHRFEAGTPNIVGGIALGEAIDYISEIGLDNIGAYEDELFDYATRQLLEFPQLRIIGTADHKASIISFVMEGIHAHDVGTVLDQEGVAVRTGHHCAQPVMERFGVPATSRASFAFYNTREEIDVLVEGLRKVIEVFK